MPAATAPAAASPSPLWLLAAALWLGVAGAGGMLAWTRAHAPSPPSAGDTLRQLETAIAGRRTALAAAGCTPDGVAGLDGPPIIPPAPAPRAPDSAHLDSNEIVRRLEHGVVLVLTASGSFGTGFFVTPDTILTNRHVIESQADGHVFVTSKSLGQVAEGQVIASSPRGPVGDPDFALIRVAPLKGAITLPLNIGIDKLEQVVAAGYPGMVVNRDVGFRKLLQGDAHAAPDLSVSEGAISGVQIGATGVVQVIHSAMVLKGNSGGPLFDRCGAVVGINTFISVDAEQSGHINYALSAKDIAAFLTTQNTQASVQNAACK